MFNAVLAPSSSDVFLCIPLTAMQYNVIPVLWMTSWTTTRMVAALGAMSAVSDCILLETFSFRFFFVIDAIVFMTAKCALGFIAGRFTVTVIVSTTLRVHNEMWIISTE